MLQTATVIKWLFCLQSHHVLYVWQFGMLPQCTLTLSGFAFSVPHFSVPANAMDDEECRVRLCSDSITSIFYESTAPGRVECN